MIKILGSCYLQTVLSLADFVKVYCNYESSMITFNANNLLGIYKNDREMMKYNKNKAREAINKSKD